MECSKGPTLILNQGRAINCEIIASNRYGKFSCTYVVEKSNRTLRELERIFCEMCNNQSWKYEEVKLPYKIKDEVYISSSSYNLVPISVGASRSSVISENMKCKISVTPSTYTREEIVNYRGVDGMIKSKTVKHRGITLYLNGVQLIDGEELF